MCGYEYSWRVPEKFKGDVIIKIAPQLGPFKTKTENLEYTVP